MYEVNFDGLIGPTHNYSGLSAGNVASQSHAAMTSHPRDAALQGIQKMRTMLQLGYKQGFFPPQMRPDVRPDVRPRPLTAHRQRAAAATRVRHAGTRQSARTGRGHDRGKRRIQRRTAERNTALRIA